MIIDPGAPITPVETPEGLKFKVLRDDLSHPWVGGNKRRKLDALFPQLKADGVTDVVTCGGTQSAHILAVAAAAAENGMRAHLLVRAGGGERPAVPTGNHLYARMLAHKVVYVNHAEYADRSTMFLQYEKALKEKEGVAKVAVIPEGGAEASEIGRAHV